MTDAAAKLAPRLEMLGVDKAFGGVKVLSGVAFSLAAGEVTALLGANGAGKSTLVKILTGVYSRDAGLVRIDGEAVDFADPRAAGRAGVRLLPQEISVIPDMSVAENICLAELPLRAGPGFRVVDRAAMRDRAARLLAELGFSDVAPDRLVATLSTAERRIVEIARALAGRARILVMDEPTAALGESEAKLIFRIVRSLKAQAVSVVYISHYLNEVFEISDRIVVLRDGRNAGEFATANARRAEVLAAMLGRDAGDLYLHSEAAAPAGAPVLEVEGLCVDGRLDRVSFAVARGEIVGVFGLIGSGVETLGRALIGAAGRRMTGEMRIGGAPFRPRGPAEAKAAGVGFVAADRKREGVIGDLSVRANMVAPFQERYRRGPFVSRDAETRQARRWIEALDIRLRSSEQPLRTLSGGNQQKVCVARWLVDGISLLILEEPTRGVDVGARREIYRELRKLARDGLGVLVLSSDVEEVAGLSDRAIVLDRGRVGGRFPRGVAPAALMAATAADPGDSAA